MSSNGVTLITCTGGRQEAFALCQKYVERQTYHGPLQWIVVDDVSSGDIYQGYCTISHIFPEPKWKPGQNTLARNLLVAIPEVQYDKVLFIEDDDWYAADYVEAMAAKLDQHRIAGEIHAHYYQIPTRRYRILQNSQHASLCQTAIRAELLPVLKEVCQETSQDFIDIRLWAAVNQGKGLYDERRCVGIKGMPGRQGIGIGHREQLQGALDPDLHMLRSWIGDDVELYYDLSKERVGAEFESFTWKGQKRYRCNRKWESGTACTYDSYDLETLRAHVMEPHNYTGKDQGPRVERRSRFAQEEDGKPVEQETVPAELQDYKFKE